ncbi:MAG TPA: LacI family transcriptional regulator [Clostridiaceae bacterium]|nr:LacI family transcriptional regulator [Clostridiaceae bacterium]
MNIKDIAKEAKVSVSTVSRVLNNKPDVNPATRTKVLKIIEKYNFRPNIQARGIVNQKNNCIGIVVPHSVNYTLNNPYYVEILRSILNAAEMDQYYTFLICDEKMDEALDVAMQKRVDGLIIVSPRLENLAILNTLEKHRIPFVIIGRMRELENHYQICVDNYLGACKAVSFLIKSGRKKVAMINGPLTLNSSIERRKGYFDCLAKYNLLLPKEWHVEGGNSIQSGYECANKLLDRYPEIDAFFVSSDIMSLGVIDALKERDIDIPDVISVVGFDNIPLAAQVTPQLTTVNQHIEKKGNLAYRILHSLLEDGEIKHPLFINIETELIVRETAVE